MAGQQVANPVQVQKFLKGIDYPCGQRELIATARQQGADENVLATLERLPDQSYNSPNDVAEAIGKLK
jgi:hypothetical protein